MATWLRYQCMYVVFAMQCKNQPFHVTTSRVHSFVVRALDFL